MPKHTLLREADHVDEPQELLRELLAQQEAEQRAAQVDWAQAAEVSSPPQQWFEGEDPKPF